MIKNMKKFLLLLGILVAVAAIISVSFVFLGKAGSQGPPPEVMAGWYLPGQNIEWTTSGPDPSPPMRQRLLLTGHLNASTHLFPALSPYSRYENYSLENTNETYLIGAWYFEDEKKYSDGAKTLSQYLKTQGSISTVELNFSEQQVQNRNGFPQYLNVTKFESGITSGLFLIVKRPLLSSRNDKIILYYGITTPKNVPYQSIVLNEMIIESLSDKLEESIGQFQT